MIMIFLTLAAVTSKITKTREIQFEIWYLLY